MPVEIAFDHHDPDFVSHHAQIYEGLRRACPVAHTQKHGGYWVISNYDNVFAVAHDDATFSSSREVVIPSTDVGRLIPLQADPPALTRYRALLAPFFAPSTLEPHALPFLERRIDECIDSFIERGHAELVSELANPIPSSLTMFLLGLDPKAWSMFADPLHSLSYSSPGSAERADAQLQVREFTSYIEDEVRDRSENPRQDMISDLLSSSYEGIATTIDEVIDLVRMVIFGGMDTVMAALSNMFVRFGENPELWTHLVNNPDDVGRAIEELLRVDAPVQGFARTTTCPAEVGGVPIPAGDSVFMLWASANLDPAQFGPDASEINIQRHPNRHMTFGVGAHRCMGSTLARIEISKILRRMGERIPDMKVSREGVVAPETIGIVKGYRRVPISFTPGRRVAAK